MKIVGIMPIKLNNERCPGKNLRLLNGKPLLKYELENLLLTNLCDEIYVYCSSDEVIDYLPKGVKFLKRPSYLDLPSANFNQIFKSFIDVIDSDIYVFIHATAPFVSTETMKECIDAVRINLYDSSFCAKKIQTFLWKDNKPLNFDSNNLPRTQDLQPIFQETSGVYVFRKEVFTKLNRRIGNNPYIKCISFKESIDVDDESDFRIAEIFANINI